MKNTIIRILQALVLIAVASSFAHADSFMYFKKKAAGGDTWCGQQGTAVFYDGIESGGLTNFTSTVGTISAQAPPAYDNSCGSYVARSSVNAEGYANKTLSSAQSEAWFTIKVALSTADIGAQWETINVAELYDSGESNFVYLILKGSAADGSVGAVGFGINTSDFTQNGTLLMTASTWYQFKIRIVAGTGNAIVSLWYRIKDGSWTQLGSTVTNATIGNITNIRAGRLIAGASGSGYLYVDDIQVSTTDVW